MTDNVSLVALYQHVLDEIKELRNERWRLAIYFTSVSAALIALLKEDELLGPYRRGFACGSAIIQILSVILFVWLIVRNHNYLTRSRNIRRAVECKLGLHRLTNEDGTTILPPAWSAGSVSSLFEMIDVTLPILVFTMLCQLGSIVLLMGASV